MMGRKVGKDSAKKQDKVAVQKTEIERQIRDNQGQSKTQAEQEKENIVDAGMLGFGKSQFLSPWAFAWPVKHKFILLPLLL